GPMVDVDKVCSRREDFACVERGTRLHHDRPRVRVGGGFAGEVAGVEFFERGVEVIGVEANDVLYQAAGADSHDVQELDDNRSIGFIGVQVALAGQLEARSSNGD